MDVHAVRPLDHVDDGTDTENDLTINFGGLVQATDADGDTVTATGTVSVVVDDDTPIAVAGTSTDSVDEDALPNGIDGGPGDIGAWCRCGCATGSVTALFQSGADVPLSYGFNTGGGTLPAVLTFGGVALTYVIGANLITATAGAGNTVFTMALDASTGAWTFTLVRPLDHADDGTNTENDLTINFGGLVQATDNDGDTVTATGTVSVVVDDDMPIAVAGTSTDGVDEDALPNGDRRRAGRHRSWCRCGCDGLGYGTVPVWRGRAAELRRSTRRVARCRVLTSGDVALTYVIGANLITAEAGRATRCSRWRWTRRREHGRSRWSGRSTMSMTAPTRRTISPSTSAAWCRRPTATATR